MVSDIATEKDAILITEDKDFGKLVFRLQLPHKGVLLICVRPQRFLLSGLTHSATTF